MNYEIIIVIKYIYSNISSISLLLVIYFYIYFLYLEKHIKTGNVESKK